VTGGLILRASMSNRKGVLKPDKIQILLDGTMVPHGEFYLVMASSLDRLFLGMKPFWGNGPGDVRFTSMATNAERISAAVPGMLRGKVKDWVTPEKGYTSANAFRAELRFSGGYTIDGEIFEPMNDEVVSITTDRRITFVRA
jgi:hypothetical protein